MFNSLIKSTRRGSLWLNICFAVAFYTIFFTGSASAATAALLTLPLSEGSGSITKSTGILTIDGTLKNGPLWTTAGIAGSALIFDGINDAVVFERANDLNNLNALTISAWIKPTTLGENNNAWVMSKAYGGSNLSNRGWRFGLSNSPTRSLAFIADFDSSHLEVRSAANSIVLGAWNHILVTWDGGVNATGVRLYINGKEVTYSEQANGAGARASDANYVVRLGNNPAGSRTFSGTIDTVALYNRVISSSEVSGLASSSATTPTPTPTPTPAPTPTPTAGLYIPAQKTTWQWQLTGTIDQSVDAEMFDIDLWDTPAATIASLKQKGKKVICYYSAGSYENWRPDAQDFPTSVLGKSNGWAGEKWLDIRNLAALGPIMEKRMDMAKAKGCDGLEPDNVDGYTNSTGFPLTGADQIKFNKFLAAEAHERGLSIGLKNDVDQIVELEPYFDFAVNEQCFQYNECDTMLPFLKAGKAVFNVEYSLDVSKFCSKANSMGIMAMKKKLDLDASRTVCWTTFIALTDPAPLTGNTSTLVTTQDWLNVRTAPSTSAVRLKLMAPGTAASILESQTDSTGRLWHHVRYVSGLAGWSAAEYLK